jgi:hypothetical protein
MGLPRLEADPIWIGGLLDLPPDPRQRGIPYLDHPVKPDDDPRGVIFLLSCPFFQHIYHHLTHVIFVTARL